MTKKELELENKMLRDEVEHLRGLVNKMSQVAPIIVNPAPVVYPQIVDLTPRITWHQPYDYHYYVTCDSDTTLVE